MSDILSLLFSECAFTLLLITEQYCALSGLSIVLVAANLNRIRMYIVISEERAYVLGFCLKWQSTQPQSSIV
jgi:hypothetical protein